MSDPRFFRKYMDVLEGSQERSVILDAIRELAYEIPEAKEYLERVIGKDIGSITTKDIAIKVVKPLIKSGAPRQLAKQGDQQVDKSQFRQAADSAMGVAGDFAASMGGIPNMSGSIRVPTPDQSSSVDINYDLGAEDFKVAKRMVKKLRPIFPRVYSLAMNGDFEAALNQLYKRLLD